MADCTDCGRLLSVQEIAQQLNVPVSWVYGKTRLQGERAIPALRVGKHLRFRREAVMAWIERQSRAARQ